MSETIGGLAIPIEPDLVRMRSDRHLKLQKQLAAQGLDGLVLLNTSGVAYATGARSPGMDAGRAGLLRSVAVVACGADHPHLFTPYPDGAPPELPADHLHGPLYPDLPDGGSRVAAALAGLFEPGARIALDELPHPMAAGVAGYDVVGSVPVMGPVKLCKTVDELACIRKAQRINELAMAEVLPLMRPGARQVELTARLLQRVFELGATANGIDPIWQVMPLTRAEGPWTTHGGLAFPTGTTDRILRDGDVVWVDSGVLYEGYASDFGRTWLVADDPQPTERQAAQYARWRAIM
jgi:Xaa-Pro dipeptidase